MVVENLNTVLSVINRETFLKEKKKLVSLNFLFLLSSSPTKEAWTLSLTGLILTPHSLEGSNFSPQETGFQRESVSSYFLLRSSGTLWKWNS